MQTDTSSHSYLFGANPAHDVRIRQKSVGLFMRKVYALMFMGIGVIVSIALAIGSSQAFFMAMAHPIVYIPVLVVPFGLIVALAFGKDSMSKMGLSTCFFALCACLGVWMSGIPRIASENPEFGLLAVVVFGAVAAMFGGLSLFGYVTKKDLSGLGVFFIAALFGLITMGLVISFLPYGAFAHTLYSILGIIIFSGLIAWDTQQIKQQYLTEGDSHGNAINGAVSLLLDFLNMFLFVIRLVSGTRD